LPANNISVDFLAILLYCLSAGKLAGSSWLTAMMTSLFPTPFLERETCEHAGFRFGNRGTHTSRTMMLDELAATLAVVPEAGHRSDYVEAIVEHNCLGKPTASTRMLTAQRLGELYALDPEVPLFRILRRVWAQDQGSGPLLALLVALARDPLFASTLPAVVPLAAGSEFARGPMREALRAAVGERLNDATLDKVARNAASSWSQAGHLFGRTFKFRRHVEPTAIAVALAMYCAYTAGFRGEELASSGWLTVLDCSPSMAWALAADAKRLGLIDMRSAGDGVETTFERLDPWKGGR
jgi:hypothetical protein